MHATSLSRLRALLPPSAAAAEVLARRRALLAGAGVVVATTAGIASLTAAPPAPPPRAALPRPSFASGLSRAAATAAAAAAAPALGDVDIGAMVARLARAADTAPTLAAVARSIDGAHEGTAKALEGALLLEHAHAARATHTLSTLFYALSGVALPHIDELHVARGVLDEAAALARSDPKAKFAIATVHVLRALAYADCADAAEARGAALDALAAAPPGSEEAGIALRFLRDNHPAVAAAWEARASAGDAVSTLVAASVAVAAVVGGAAFVAAARLVPRR